jgi:tetratricopeptide (TPR) repeat protein
VSQSAHDPCVDPADLGAALDGALSSERAADVTRHISRCAKCRTLLERAAEVEHEVKRSRRRFIWSLAAAAVIAIVLVALPIAMRRQQAPAAAIARLAGATRRDARTVEARLAGFPWAPPPALRRATGSMKTPQQMEMSGLAAQVLREFENDRSAGALHARGVALLVAGEAGMAVPLLEEASRSAPDDARIWNELSAAYLAAARPGDDSILRHALDSASNAIRLAPPLPEPYFNRALALERLDRPRDAAQAWNDYLRHDPRGAWATEARRHIADIGGARE